MFDVIVIGGGVIGGAVLRELTKYRLSVAMAEKESDVSMGQSKANSGIVHAGFDALPGSRKAKFNAEGCRMMPRYAEELGVKYKNIGSLVVAFNGEERRILEELKERGVRNGVEGLEILEGEALRAAEPALSERAVAALYAPTAGIICPYTLTIASIGNAMDNGAELFTDFCVTEIREEEGGFTLRSEDGRTLQSRVIINCAGLGSGKIAALTGDEDIRVGGRRGEYLLLDKDSGTLAKHTLFFTPTALGKGILVSPTADGNLLLGPTAEESDGCTDTSAAMLSLIQEKAKELCPQVPLQNVITSFSGVRAYSSEHDFIIRAGKNGKVIHCAGIESPGLTSAPAIAKYVVEELVSGLLPLEENPDFCGVRRRVDFASLTAEEKNELIRKDPSYGRLVCYCEKVTEGEILQAIRENPPARSVDAVKRRTRAGMGKCQGGFCQPGVAELLSGALHIPFEQVEKSGKGSELVVGRSK